MSDVYGSGGEGIEPEIVWCPACGIHLPEGPNTLRVRADGIRRHIDCDTPVRTEEQHARDLASDEVEMPAVTGLLNKLGVEGTAYRQPALATGPQHFMARAGTDYCCDCPIGFDHDAMGRAMPAREQRTFLAKGVDAHRLFAPDPEVQLIVDSLEEEQAAFRPGGQIRADVERAVEVTTAAPWRASGPMAVRRTSLRQALIGDILAGTTVWEKPPLYSDVEKLAENLLDSGWIPSTERMAR